MSLQVPFHLIKKSDSGDEFAPFDPLLVAVPPTLTNQLTGECLVYFDPAQGFVIPLKSSQSGAGAYFAGINCDQVPANYGSIDAPAGVTPNAARNVTRITRAAQCTLKATAGEFITAMKPIYAGADEQTMSVSGSNSIGFVDPEQPVVVSATAGQLILCRVRANYPPTPLS